MVCDICGNYVDDKNEGLHARAHEILGTEWDSYKWNVVGAFVYGLMRGMQDRELRDQ